MNKVIEEVCKTHGLCPHTFRKDGYTRCRKCAVEAVQKRRKKIKHMAVEHFGRKCADCGLQTKHNCVYDFHHLEPFKKDFGISNSGHTKSWEKIKAELEKCTMICANCHRIRHIL
jgi:hypothetical protein